MQTSRLALLAAASFFASSANAGLALQDAVAATLFYIPGELTVAEDAAAPAGSGYDRELRGLKFTAETGESFELDYLVDWVRASYAPGTGAIRLEVAPRSVIEIRFDDMPEDFPQRWIVTTEGYRLEGTRNEGFADITYMADQLRIAPEEAPEALDIAVDLRDFAGSFRGSIVGDILTGTYNAQIGDLAYALKFDDGQSKMDTTARVADLSVEGTGDYILSGDPADYSAYLSGERGFEARFSSGETLARSESQTPMGSVISDARAESGVGTLSLTGGSYVIEGEGKGFGGTVTGPMMPPIEYDAESYQIGAKVPLRQSEEPEEAALRISLAQLRLGEGVWGMFDPQAMLPRDPGNLTIDLGASVRWLVNLAAAVATKTEPTMEGSPIQAESVTIRDIHLDFAGLDLDAEGAFTLDNSGPKPVPSGEAIINLEGVNTLMQRLTQMGLLKPEQTMAVSAMIGVFGRSTGEDAYTSQITVTNGQISANGMPLPFAQ